MPAAPAIAETVCAWARQRPDVVAVALVGSWARGTAGADSDVDVVLVVEDPEHYEHHDAWPAGDAVRTRRWGVLLERRLALEDGTELDLGFVPRTWASTEPLDAGTRRVAAQGLVALYDPEGLLEPLARLRP